MPEEENNSNILFQDLNLANPVLKALNQIGYEIPTPIQAQMIPFMLQGRDVIGQAQTGTGKTAAFALPLLSQIDLKLTLPQVLVLAPTRELAIQVSEAFGQYATFLKGFHVLPIYGGQEYGGQLRRLKRGVHVVVGTPGRVMDHMRRGTLNLENLRSLVLDEADEMLRMGFIDDVRWILEQTPDSRQIALFSATMPKQIREIAQEHLSDPKEITIKSSTATVKTTRQRYWMVSGLHKLDALTRILEAENFDGVLIFVRTRTSTVELAEKLEARGFAAAPLNGDLSQSRREKTIDQLKSEKINIIVATDVAARGLDVDRISHVVNYDIPYDTESYIHRIGRTGRAGREGEAILFVSPREKRILRSIEKATRQKIELMDLPSTERINNKRIASFKQNISDTLATDDLAFFQQMLESYRDEHDIPAIEIAAALAKMVQGKKPLLLKEVKKVERKKKEKPRPQQEKTSKEDAKKIDPSRFDEDMERYRIELGSRDGITPKHIVGAIANEAGIDNEFIGLIKIYKTHSTVDLPIGMPEELLEDLQLLMFKGKSFKMSHSTMEPDSGRLRKRRETGGKSKIKKSSRQRKRKSRKF